METDFFVAGVAVAVAAPVATRPVDVGVADVGDAEVDVPEVEEDESALVAWVVDAGWLMPSQAEPRSTAPAAATRMLAFAPVYCFLAIVVATSSLLTSVSRTFLGAR